MGKIVVLDGLTLGTDGISWAALSELGEVEMHECSSEGDVLARAAGAEVLITNKAPVTAAAIANARQLRGIAVTATGYDCVDIGAARARSIPVCNVPEYGTYSVAQFVFALLLELCHHVGLHAQAVREGEWSRAPVFCFWKTPQVELAGKTMGIVGLGRIGRQVGALAHAFGMKVIAHNRSHPAGLSFPHALVSLDDLFAQADVISLHCPLTVQTAGLVNEGRLARIKTRAVLINTARGGLVVEKDLARALEEGRLAGAAVDVVSREPIQPDNPLLNAPHCLITPHMAWTSQEARRRLLDATVANVAHLLAGQATNVVNA